MSRSSAPLRSDHSRYGQLVQLLEERLVSSLRHVGWSVDLEVGGAMLIEREAERYVVDLEVAREPRTQLLCATLADALLRARAAAFEAPRHLPLAIVGAPSLSDALAAAVREYAARFAPQDAFGLIDAQGRLELHGGAGLSDVRPREEHALVARALRPKVSTLFSDRHQWMLKVLLAPRLPGDMLAASRAAIHNASQLARAAKVSVPSAARFLSAMREEGFVELKRGGLELTRVGELLARWRASLPRPRELHARWVVPAINLRKQLAASVAAYVKRRAKDRTDEMPFVVDAQGERREPRAALGLFAACEQLGFSFLHGSPLHLYLEDPSPVALEQIGLMPARAGQVAHVVVRIPRFPESTFRGNVIRQGAPVADVVQSWLDVADHPARGSEQAELLWKGVLQQAVA